MVKNLYARLAFGNLKKNRRIYLPYILTCIITVMMFYMIYSLYTNESIAAMHGGQTIQYTLNFGTVIVGIFAVIFLFYTNSFVIKRRQKEFGLFNVLGMEKRHLGIVLLFEVLYIALFSIIVGIALGMLFDKLMYLIISRILHANYGAGFYISWKSTLFTTLLFACIFAGIYIFSLIRINISKPVELLKGDNIGEKEPKTRHIMAILGIITLAAGYALAIFTKDAVDAVLLFFIAVILVIIGTYFLFTAGSIALLKVLKKNKKYYYKPNHFTSVSGMTYRMKQNSVGLASICILATMLLVTISATTSFMFGRNDMIAQKYPYDLIVQANVSENANSTLTADIRLEIEKNGMTTEQEILCNYLPLAAFSDGNKINLQKSAGANPLLLLFVTAQTYNDITGSQKQLDNDEIIISESNIKFNYEAVNIFDTNYTVKEKVDNFVKDGLMANDIAGVSDGMYLVVSDETALNAIYQKYKAEYGENTPTIQFSYGVNFKDTKEQQIVFSDALSSMLQEKNYNARYSIRVIKAEEFMSLYGGIFFLGVYLGLLFLMGAILIIYYKQISEGYEDKKRFEIMQKVGMSYAEVKKSINTQILMVFFLPLIMAGIHVAFAFPMINKIMSLLALLNTKLFALCTLGCFAAFSLIYVFVYFLTAKIYHRIVKNRDMS